MGLFRKRRTAPVSSSPDPQVDVMITQGTTAATQGDVSSARDMFSDAMSKGNSEQKIRAARYMGVFLADKDRDASRRGHLYVLETGDPEHAPEAALSMAHSYETEGDDTTARKYYNLAINSKHPIIGPRAARLLAERLEKSGKIDEAIQLYMIAAVSDNQDSAMSALGALKRLRG